MTDPGDAQRAAGWHVLEPGEDSDQVEHLAAEILTTGCEYLLLAASRRGRSHEHTGTYREDAFAVGAGSSGAWVITVADGAGSCRLSRVGARIATEVARDSVLMSLHEMTGAVPSEPRSAVLKAAHDARLAVADEAHKRTCSPVDLSCTLLILLYLPAGQSGHVAAFQVGDGLVAAIDAEGKMTPLTGVDTATWAGETRFLTSDLGDTWDHRAQLVAFPEPPHGFIVASDGVADDLVPFDKNLPILWRAVDEVVAARAPDEALLELLNYHKRGSFDDRTLVVARRSQR